MDLSKDIDDVSCSHQSSPGSSPLGIDQSTGLCSECLLEATGSGSTGCTHDGDSGWNSSCDTDEYGPEEADRHAS